MLHKGRYTLIALAWAAMIALPPRPTQAQNPSRPFSLPFNVPPGPGTWLVGQQYGNTTGAYNFGAYWYSAGQGLHFGIDFSAPCGTPVVAIGDGVVDQVDNFSFGILPHNLTIFHRDLGLTSLYGHLLKKPTVTKGQVVKRGEVVALSGDPEGTCESRPHLHLEVRSRDYNIAHNPATLIDADWSMLSTMGNFGASFTKDLFNPNRWQTIYDQPDVDFNEARLNNYRAAWPPPSRSQPVPQTLPAYTAPPIGTPTFRRLTEPGCCSLAWWSPDSRSVRFWNGPEGKRAALMAVGVDGGTPQPILSGPVLSPDGQYDVRLENGRVNVLHLTDMTSKSLITGGSWPRFSPGSTRLLWQWAGGDSVPGSAPPQVEVWVANPDGSGLLSIVRQPGVSAHWLDDDRILLSRREGLTRTSTLSIYTISTRQIQPLVTAKSLRNVSVAPGGRHILYFLAFQDDRAASGLYLLETRPGASPAKLPFFGGWRWRDSNSILYIPYEPGKPISFALYDINTGQSRSVTDPAEEPIGILNGDWSVSPNGQYIVFWNAKDSALWLVNLSG